MNEHFKDCGNFVNINNERIICFNVSKTYRNHKRPTLYECTCKYWKLNGQRANKADLVFAICGVILLEFLSHIVGSRHNARNTKEDGSLKERQYPILHI